METVVANAKNTGNSLTWKAFRDACFRLAQSIDFSCFDSIYGIPRGGVFVAVELNSYSGLPIVWEPSERSLIVDDVCDSGRTSAPFDPKKLAVLFNKGRVSQNRTPGFVGEKTNDWIVFPWENEKDVESLVVRELEFLGENPNREGLVETPSRVRKSWNALYGGYSTNPREVLSKRFNVDRPDAKIAPVILRNIEFYSMCEHHMLPFFGEISIGYLPKENVVGISKLARLVECFSRRLQIQERLVEQIADALQEELKPTGIYVYAKAQHFCMVVRGVQKRNAEMIAVAARGDFEPIRELLFLDR